MSFGKSVVDGLKRGSYLLRAAGWATLLGVIETLSSKRGRRVLGVVAIAGVSVWFVMTKPIQSIEPGEMAIRVNRLTGSVSEMHEGWAWRLPGLHRLRYFPLKDQTYRPGKAALANGDAPYQSLEGLSIGVEVTVRYALAPESVKSVALKLPDDLDASLIEPMVDGVLHRTFAQHTVREIFSSDRSKIEAVIRSELTDLLSDDGILIRDVFLGNVDLPEDYKRGLEGLLSEELNSEKMKYTLELRQKQVLEAALQADAEKVRRETAAEAAGQEQLIAARARAEAMQHIIPLKQQEIKQRSLEADASKVQRIKMAEANATARRIESRGEADSRRTLAEAEAYRLEITGKANSENMARDSALIAKNPLLIQKTLADKLGDNIQVIIAPPNTNGFIADGLLGATGTR